MSTQPNIATLKPNWKQVWTFVGVTFAVTYLLDLVLYLTVGYTNNPATLMLLQLQMLLPAAVAMALQLLVFRNSPLFRMKEPPRWFFYFYLAYTLIFVALTILVMVLPNPMLQTMASLVTIGLAVLGSLLAILLRLISGRDSFRRVGLAGGKVRYYLTFGLALVLIYGLMAGLNALFGLGHTIDVQALLGPPGSEQAAALGSIPAPALLAILGLQTIILNPLLGIVIAMGEEYGWRGYLQSELVKMGKVRGLVLLGVIWGLWHAPIIAMGHNYPGYPVIGIGLMTLYTTALAFFLGYAVLKSASTWLAAFLHAINNALAGFFLGVVYVVNDPVRSFGVGVYGLLVWAAVVAVMFLLDLKTWRGPLTADQVAIPIDLPAGDGWESRPDQPTLAMPESTM